MIKSCAGCTHWNTDTMCIQDRHAQCMCSMANEMTVSNNCCPGFTEPETGSIMMNRLTMIFGMMGHATSSTIPEPGKSVESTEHKTMISKRESKQAITRETDYETSITLFKHQKDAREKFRDKNEIALFFEMGCGKSLTAMSIACDKYNAGIISNVLIIAPNDIHKQWFDDLCDDNSVLSKLAEDEHVSIVGQIIGGRSGQKQFYEFEDDGKMHLVCVNIDTFSTPHKWEPIVEWARSGKTAIILDEATVIKNPSSKRSQRLLYEFNDVTRRRKTITSSVKTENTQVRMILTGTPVTNGPVDLWSLMEFVKPNYFGRNYYSFQNYYGMHTKLQVYDGVGNARSIQILVTPKTWLGIKNCESYEEAAAIYSCSEDTYLTIKNQKEYLGPYKHADELKEQLAKDAIFAKLVDCVDMPKVNYITRKISLSPQQQVAYTDMRNDLIAQYDNKTVIAKNKLVASLRLQQISSGFIVAHDTSFDYDTGEDYDLTPDEVVWLGDSNPRLEVLMNDIAELDKPIIIFTRFSAEAAKIYDVLKDKYSTCLITGWKTVGSIEGFKNREHDIMVANIAKLARGFNLQVAHTTIYYSNTFSMELRQQSEFRTFRMGQEYPCTYIDYESCDIDRTINAALKLKKGLLEYIREKKLEELI